MNIKIKAQSGKRKILFMSQPILRISCTVKIDRYRTSKGTKKRPVQHHSLITLICVNRNVELSVNAYQPGLLMNDAARLLSSYDFPRCSND